MNLKKIYNSFINIGQAHLDGLVGNLKFFYNKNWIKSGISGEGTDYGCDHHN